MGSFAEMPAFETSVVALRSRSARIRHASWMTRSSAGNSKEYMVANRSERVFMEM